MIERKIGFTDLLIFLLILIISLIFQNFILGVIILFFMPGYLLIQVIYPNEPPDNSKITIPLGIGMSTILSGIIGLLHYYFIGNRFSVVITFNVFIGVLWILIFFQRLKLGKGKRVGVLSFPSVKMGAWEFVKVISLVALFISFGYYYWLTNNQQPEFTEFYILGPNGLATGYPKQATENTPLNLTAGVINHEGETVNYTIVGLVGEEPIGILHPFEVLDGERREEELTLVFPHVGDNQRVDILLGGDGLEYPYRRLTLWVNVLGEDYEIN